MARIVFKITDIQRTKCQIGENVYGADVVDTLENVLICKVKAIFPAGPDPQPEELRKEFRRAYFDFIESPKKNTLEIGDIL